MPPRKSRRSLSGKQPPQAPPTTAAAASKGAPLALDPVQVQQEHQHHTPSPDVLPPPSPPLPAFSRPPAPASKRTTATGHNNNEDDSHSSATKNGSSTPLSVSAASAALPATAPLPAASSSSLTPNRPSDDGPVSPLPQQSRQHHQQSASVSHSRASQAPLPPPPPHNLHLLKTPHLSSGSGSVVQTPLTSQQQFPSSSSHSASPPPPPPPPPPPALVKRRLGGTNNVGATTLDGMLQFPKAVGRLWRFLFLGVVTCLDKVLDLYLLPLRVLLLQRLTMRHIVLGVFALLGALSLALFPFGEGPGHAFSYWYHLVQGVSALKLYMMCSMLEVSERLVSNLGGDVLEALWVEIGSGGDIVATAVPLSANSSSSSTSTHSCTITTSSSASRERARQQQQQANSNSDGKETSSLPPPTAGSRFLRNISLIVAGVVLTSVHAYVIVLQVVVYNVALNGDNYSLIALLASGNFTELRKMVFRKCSSDDLFRTACGDVIEQMQIVAFFCVMLLRHSMSLGFGTVELEDLFFILLVEIVIDTMKHAFIIRNNGIKESIYSRFEAVWFWDAARDLFRNEYLSDCRRAMADPVSALGLSAPEGFPPPPVTRQHHHQQQQQPRSLAPHKPTSREASAAAGASSPKASTTASGELGSGNVAMTPLALPPHQQQQQQQQDGARRASSTGSSRRLGSGSTPLVSPTLGSTTTVAGTTSSSSPGRNNNSTNSSNIGSATLPPRLQPVFGSGSDSQQQQQSATVTPPPPPPPAPASTHSSSSSLTSAQQYYRNTVFSSVVDESMLLGFPSRRVGLVTVPYVAVLWWMSAPLVYSFAKSAATARLLVWGVVVVVALKLLIRAVNRGLAARWVCRARSWGPGRVPPSAIAPASAATSVGTTVDDLSKAEQQLLEKLDRVQQFRFGF